tara:strand:+ start:1454 stop:1768 length:315 start_codon:yes stop_codon:yes gene_type:complete
MKKDLELYEVLYLVNPGFMDQELENKIEFYRNLLTGNGSSVMVQNRGKRSLSYRIKGFTTANYIQMVFVGNQKLIQKLDQQISRDESVIRHLTTKLPDRREIFN